MFTFECVKYVQMKNEKVLGTLLHYNDADDNGDGDGDAAAAAAGCVYCIACHRCCSS